MSDSRKKDLPRGFSRRRLKRIGMRIPINLERILLGAAQDDEFRERLLEDPAGAAAARGFELEGTEEAMLAAMDRSTLEAMVQRFGPVGSRRSSFARHVTAAVAGSMIISVASGCVESAGIDPEPTDAHVDSTPDPVGGIFPDWPPDAPDIYEEADVEDEDMGGSDVDEDAADDAEEDSDG